MYVNKEYYANTFKGEPVDETDFPVLLQKAFEIIEELCMYRITEERLNSYSTYIQECVKKAICAEIEYLDANGGFDIDSGVSIQSAGLGKFNYTGVSTAKRQSVYAPRALRILAPTGLLYRGGRCL